MPHIRMRAMNEDQVRAVSNGLTRELAQILGTEEDNFTVEWIPSTFFHQGAKTAGYPFVEVLWFERTQEAQDRCANIITEKVRSVTQAADVVVVFHVLQRKSYYENSRHF